MNYFPPFLLTGRNLTAATAVAITFTLTISAITVTVFVNHDNKAAIGRCCTKKSQQHFICYRVGPGILLSSHCRQSTNDDIRY